jgi:hypothetical protein
LSNGQQLGPGEEAEPFLESPLGMRLGAATSTGAVTNKTEYPSWSAARLRAMARCVSLTPGGPNKSEASPCATQRHPADSRILPRIERRRGGKVEAVEVAHRGEVGDLPRHLDAPLVLARDLALEQKKGQRLAEGQLAPGGLVQQTVELVADRR